MPQASDEQRAQWGGDCGVGEEKAVKFLIDRGYKLTSRWNWLIPEGRNEEDDELDYSAGAFLVDEWDWGWFVEKLGEGEELVDAKKVTGVETG